MAAIEQKLALEALKPTAGFISALIAPKVEKVKGWAEEKELKGQLEPEVLSRILENYLTKLAKRVAEITTISFPLQKLNIDEAYEPLSLELIGMRNEKYEYTIDNIIEYGESVLIIDGAGMGKSTFSKYFVSQILFKSERIPLFFELRKLNRENDLVESLAKELDSLGRQFSRELFYELLKKGKFIVILDGFDEVDVDSQEEISNQIYDLSVKGGDNLLLLTSRPQESLPDLIDSKTYKFSEFTTEQAKSLVLRYDSISKLDVGKRLIEQLDAVPSRFIKTPLLVSLLYRTFGTNNSIADRVCTFYDEIYHALYKGHDLMNKNGYIRDKKSKLDFEDFRRVLRALCYYMAASKKTSFENWSEAVLYIDKAAKMSSVDTLTSSAFLDDLLVAVPLMQRDGSEYKFLHKTILEFFAAEYIVFRTDSYELAKKIFNSRVFASFEKVFDFIFDISPVLYERVVTKCHADEIAQDFVGDTDGEIILNSLALCKKSKIGLWEFDKHKEGVGEHLHFISPREDKDFEEGFFTTSFETLIIGNVKYFLVICFTDLDPKMHHIAWKQLSIKLDLDVDFNVDLEMLGISEKQSLLKTLGENRWVSLEKDLVEELSKYKVLVVMAANALRSSRFRFYEEARVFSKEKNLLFLSKLNEEGAVDNELDELLM